MGRVNWFWRTLAGLFAACIAAPAPAASTDPQLSTIAVEARQAIAVINWFYVQHRACPQPARADELSAMQRELGDGFTIEPRGQFVEIRGIAMTSGWLYYAPASHPDRCTLWRKVGFDPALIWRRHRDGGKWAYDPGDGGAEQPIKLPQ